MAMSVVIYLYYRNADNTIYYIDASNLLENRALIKFIRNYIRDRSGVLSITSFRANARLPNAMAIDRKVH